MWIVCPKCGTASWISTGKGINFECKDNKIEISAMTFDANIVSWFCKCFKNN